MTTISARIHHLRHLAREAHERALMAIAWRLPRSIAYWAAIRVMAHATTGKHGNTLVPELRATEAIERWSH